MRRWQVIVATGLVGVSLHSVAQPSLRYGTPVMGTVEQPTLDGGQINAGEAEKYPPPSVDLAPADTSLPSVNPVRTVLRTTPASAFAYVKQRSIAWGLPPAVAFIPWIESGYQTHAVSPKGAAGAWQLMPATAKAYGLSPQARFDFRNSTEVALQLLRDLHAQFGHWTLALAAYNAGSGRVQRALQRHPHAQWLEELGLPRETQGYVQRLVALQQALLSYSGSTATCGFF